MNLKSQDLSSWYHSWRLTKDVIHQLPSSKRGAGTKRLKQKIRCFQPLSSILHPLEDPGNELVWYWSFVWMGSFRILTIPCIPWNKNLMFEGKHGNSKKHIASSHVVTTQGTNPLWVATPMNSWGLLQLYKKTHKYLGELWTTILLMEEIPAPVTRYR